MLASVLEISLPHHSLEDMIYIHLDEGNTKHLNGRHTVFGQTIEGLDVIQKIQQGDKMLKVEVLEVDPAIEAHELQKLKSWR